VQILFSRPPRLHLLKSLSLKSRAVVIQAVAAILVAVIQAVAATPVAAVIRVVVAILVAVIRAVAVTPVVVAIRAVVVIPVAVMATEMAAALREPIATSN